MTAFRTSLAMALLVASRLAAQDTLPPDVASAIDQARGFSQVAQAAQAAQDMQKVQLPQIPPQPPAPPKARRVVIRSGQYERGTQLLDERKYDEAIAVFDQIVAAKGARSDGALYWKAYALNRLGRSDDALAAIAALRRDYGSGNWIKDAQVLEAEVKRNAGHPVSPADETNEDIKLMAINSLMGGDPDRAIPLLDGLLKGTASNRLKERAMFVLTQSKSPKAEQILTDYATGAGNPDLQIKAIRYIGMSGTPEAQQRLVAAYTASYDPAVKDEIVRALMSGGGTEHLLQLARTEKTAARRIIIIRSLAVARATTSDVLTSLYTADNDPEVKHAIINGLLSRNDAKTMVELARKESDPGMKKYIVERLSAMRNSKEATDYMLELLK
jgi:tetratricopeptide (TPR) repeat protein